MKVCILTEVEDCLHSLFLDIAQLLGRDIGEVSRSFDQGQIIDDLTKHQADQLIAMLATMGYEAEPVKEEGGE